jgi:hypothetical protein
LRAGNQQDDGHCQGKTESPESGSERSRRHAWGSIQPEAAF